MVSIWENIVDGVDVGAIIQYALFWPVVWRQGVLNYGPMGGSVGDGLWYAKKS